MEITTPDDLVDIANLGLTLAEAKRLLAGVQREIVAAQARSPAVRRPECPHCGGFCRVKDYRDHVVSTLFGQVCQSALKVGSSAASVQVVVMRHGPGAP